MLSLCKKTIFLAIASLLLFSTPLFSGVGTTDPFTSIDDEITNTENALRSYTDENGQAQYIEKGEFPAFDQTIDQFLTKTRSYLEDYKKTYEQIPDVMTPDVYQTVETELKKNGYKTIAELNETFFDLETEFSEILKPYVDVFTKKHYEKIKKEAGYSVEKPLGKAETVEGIKAEIELAKVSWDKFIKEYENQYKNIEEAIKDFSKTAKVYVAEGKIELQADNTLKFVGEKVPEGNVSIKKLILMDQIARLSLLELKRSELYAKTQELKSKKGSLDIVLKVFSSENTIEERRLIISKLKEAGANPLADLAYEYSKHGKLNKKQTKELNELTESFRSVTDIYYNPTPKTKISIKLPMFAKIGLEYSKSFASFYIAMLSTRVMNSFTGGSLATDTYEKQEALKIRQGVEYKETDNVTKDLLGNPLDLYLQISFASFSAVSAGINIGVQQTKIMKNIMRRSYQMMYPAKSSTYIKNTLFKGVALPAVSMTAGMYAAQIVPQFVMFYTELFSEYDSIRDAAWEMFKENNFSGKAIARIGSVMGSFTMAELLLSDKIIDAGKIMTYAIKTKKCSDLYTKIKELRQHQISTTDKSWFKNTTKMIFVFNVADLIENLTFYRLFPGIFDTKTSEEYGQKMAMAEMELLIQVLLSAAPNPTDEELNTIYDKFDGYLALGDIIDVFRASPKTIKDTLALVSEENGGDIATTTFMQLIDYIGKRPTYKSLDDIPFTETLFAYLTDDVERKKKASENEAEWLKSDQNIKETLDYAKELSIQIRSKTKSEGTKNLADKVDPSVIANTIIDAELTDNAEALLKISLETGDMDGAIKHFEDLATNYYKSAAGLTSHISSVLTKFKGTSSTYQFTLSDVNDQTITISDVTLQKSISKTDCATDFARFGYLLAVLYPEMMTSTFTNDKGKPANEYAWRKEILMSLAKYLHTKIQGCCSEADYRTGIIKIYSLIYTFTNNIPKDAVANKTDTDVLAAGAMFDTLFYLGLPDDVNVFIKKK